MEAHHAIGEKTLATARAQAALLGIVVTLSDDDAGQHLLVLTRGSWTRRVYIEELAGALAEAKALPA